MQATIQHLRPAGPGASSPHHPVSPFEYSGPERRRSPAPAARWLALMLEEVGHGMLLLGDGNRLLHANHAARAELDPQHPLCLVEGRLRARSGQDETALHAALHAAGRGLRRLLTLGQGEQRASVAVVPLAPIDGQPLVLVSLGKRRLSHRLTLQCFARCHGLTGAETRVLEQLCAGTEPMRIAALHGVEISTVRTQITCIRQKTGTGDITALLMQVAQLPPMVSALRSGFGGADGAESVDDGLRLIA
jgi:DNA-binding CsgD family transcriptional regulator